MSHLQYASDVLFSICICLLMDFTDNLNGNKISFKIKGIFFRKYLKFRASEPKIKNLITFDLIVFILFVILIYYRVSSHNCKEYLKY
jgi:hypothetical protein